jgi:hypothetical protein
MYHRLYSLYPVEVSSHTAATDDPVPTKSSKFQSFIKRFPCLFQKVSAQAPDAEHEAVRFWWQIRSSELTIDVST